MALDVVTQPGSVIVRNELVAGAAGRRAGPGSASSWRHGFTVIFAASFVVFLAIALFAQLSARSWRPWLPGAEGERSLIGGVKSAVYTFMSYLN